jgi:hypothetical protein
MTLHITVAVSEEIKNNQKLLGRTMNTRTDKIQNKKPKIFNVSEEYVQAIEAAEYAVTDNGSRGRLTTHFGFNNRLLWHLFGVNFPGAKAIHCNKRAGRAYPAYTVIYE